MRTNERTHERTRRLTTEWRDSDQDIRPDWVDRIPSLRLAIWVSLALWAGVFWLGLRGGWR